MKIGFNFKKLLNKVVQNENNIANHETRITTLENSPGGGTATSVFYIFNDYLYKDSDLTTKVTADEYDTAEMTTIISISNLSDMENIGIYKPLFSKSTVDDNGHNVTKVFIMLENGTLKGVYTDPYEQQSGNQ